MQNYLALKSFGKFSVIVLYLKRFLILKLFFELYTKNQKVFENFAAENVKFSGL